MFRKLMKLEEAQKLVNDFGATPLGFEKVSLLEAHNRVLSEELISALDIPPFDRSTVDGYAVKAEDTFGAEENLPVRLRDIGAVKVGELPTIKVAKGETAEIVTGAPIPLGANAVVMVEDTESKNGIIDVFNSVAKNENIMRKGTDIRKGETLLSRGQILGSREIGMIAAIGKGKIAVYLAPKVAILSTGAEVTEPGCELPPGKIYDINAFSLSSAVLESGGKPIYLGIASDEEDELRKILVRALLVADLVLTSAGVSVGPKDLIPKTIDSLGKPGVVLSGIAVKPGKPTTVGLIGNKPIFSLPGHPTSALLIFHLLASPLIQLLAGRTSIEINTTMAIAGTRMFSAKGRRTFIMVNLKRDKMNRLVADPVGNGASGAITTLAKADGYVEIPENFQFINEGDQLCVTLFKSTI